MSVVSFNNEVGSVDSCDKLSNVNGKNLLMSFGPAWHGKGLNFSRLFSLSDIVEHFPELLYTIEHLPCFSYIGGELTQINGVNSIVFSSTDGNGNKYQKFFEARSASDKRPIIQPVEALEMLETIFAKFGAKLSTVGSLYGGETFFVSAQMVGGYKVMSDDHIWNLNYLDNFVNLAGLAFFGSDTRIVCRNTAKSSWQSGFQKTKIIHKGDIKSRMTDAMQAFEKIIALHPKHVELLEASAHRMVNHYSVIDRVLDACLGIGGLNVNISSDEMRDIPAAAAARANALGLSSRDDVARMEVLLGKQFKKRNSVVSDILTRYESSTCETARGSAYSVYQALTEYANYGLESKNTDRADGNQFLSLASGKASLLNDAAWNLVVAV